MISTEELAIAVSLLNKEDKQKLQDLNTLANCIMDFSEKIQMLDSKRKEKDKQAHERYNIFDVLTKHHLEELHTRFIHDLLNPKGLHDFKEQFLKSFIDIIKKEEDLNQVLPVLNNSDYRQAVVEKEHSIPVSDDESIYGRIDIIIRFPDFIIAIENKIRHHEGDKQLKRYVDYCKTFQKPFIVLFLTLNGRNAVSTDGEAYFPVSYRKHIIEWLQECLTVALSYPMVHTGILSYKNLLESKFLTTQSTQFIMDITDILLKPENHILIKYQLQISACVNEVRNKLRNEFFKKVYGKIKKINKDFEQVKDVVDPVELNQIWDKKYRGFLLKDESYTIEVSPDIKVYFLIEHNWEYLYYGLVTIQNVGRKLSLGKECLTNKTTLLLSGMMNQSFEYALDHAEEDEEMFSVVTYYPLKGNLSFPNDNLNYDFVTKMDEVVDEFVVDIKKYLEVYKINIDKLKAEN